MGLWKALTVTVDGVSPLLLHNGRTADPLDPYAKRIKEIASIRKKSDHDYLAMSALEWEAGLYTTPPLVPGDLDKQVVIVPAACLKAAIVRGAMKEKNGPHAKSGLLVEGNPPLVFDGPKTLRGVKDDPSFWDKRNVRVSSARLVRTRPVFNRWSLTFPVSYNPKDVNRASVERWIATAGEVIGLGDNRPENGRFVVRSCD